MTGDILSKHEDLAYWIEPKYIWKYRNPKAKNDLRSESEATPQVCQYIQKRFFDYTKKHHKTRFLEKTPSNVFRVAFINKIFPDALFIQLLRNGNATALSAEKKWTAKPEIAALTRRITYNDIPLVDAPFYIGSFLKKVIWKFLRPNSGTWGQQFPGIRDYRSKNSLIETCAKQWSEGLKSSQAALDKIKKERIFRIKYEDLIESPQTVISDLLNFLELEPSEKVLTYAKDTIKNNAKEYTSEEKEKIKLIQPIIEEQMRIYGYE